MTVAGPLIVLVAFAFALFLLSQPFWPGQLERADEADALRRADLEAAKIAKYREIRDAALDHSTGKLSDADWKPIDARLRTEAVQILDELDGLAHIHGTAAEDHEDLPAAPAATAEDEEPPPATDDGASTAGAADPPSAR
ncbi:hypothetical protein [Patulibacter minatonensis]|uniref:hypothetical protein n=1 Tax=Patulibacter minatonensis TaxID=298163 RepID=UPI00047E0BBF|nr:hypothetical protein [Patulibacter minatonensis]